MGLKEIAFSIIMFVAIVTACILLMGNLSSNYDEVNIQSDSYGDIWNYSDELYSISSGQNDKVLGGANGTTIEAGSTEDSLFQGGYSAVRSMPSYFNIFQKVIIAVADALNLGPVGAIIVTFLTIFMILAIFFAILYLIFRVKA